MDIKYKLLLLRDNFVNVMNLQICFLQSCIKINLSKNLKAFKIMKEYMHVVSFFLC